MSIERHIERTADDPGRIHALTIDTEENGKLLFDVEREISESDWLTMEAFIKRVRNSKGWAGQSVFINSISEAHILSPERFPRLDLEPNQWQTIIQYTEKYFADHFARLKLAFPEQIPVELNESILAMVESKLQEPPSAMTPETYVLRHLYDKKPFDDEEWRLIKRRIQEAIRHGFPFGDLTPVRLMCFVKIIDPKRYKEVAPTDEVWKFLRNSLSSQREHENIDGVLACATLMKILASEKAVMTNHGLVLTMHKDNFKIAYSSRPERKAGGINL